MLHRTMTVALTIAAVGLTACGGDQAEQDEGLETVPPATATTPLGASAPDTTAEALWAHLQSARYRSWPKWPGKTELYAGTEPHGMLLTTYVNPLALDALTNGAASLPAGAIIVKENYMPDSTFAAATVMYKAAGYNAQHNDWYWAKYDPAGVPEVAGRADMCQQCHGANRQRDYLMTAMPQR